MRSALSLWGRDLDIGKFCNEITQLEMMTLTVPRKLFKLLKMHQSMTYQSELMWQKLGAKIRHFPIHDSHMSLV